MKRVTAAIVTYNRKDLLKESLEALFSQKTPCQILVVDNASTDQTHEMLQPWIDEGRIKYLNTGENLGGAGGFSIAIEEAVKSGSDYIWIMDDDTIVQNDTLEKLMEQAEAYPDAAFFSSQANWIDGSPNRMNAQRLLEKSSGQKAVACREATFVSLLINAKSVIRHGLPIREFFIWGDDIEYTRRLSFQDGGFYVPESVVVHKTKNNEGSNIVSDDIERLNRYRYAYRNEVYIAKQEGLFRKLRQLAKISYHSVRVLLFSKEAKMKKLSVIWKSSVEGLSFSPSVRMVDIEENRKNTDV